MGGWRDSLPLSDNAAPAPAQGTSDEQAENEHLLVSEVEFLGALYQYDSIHGKVDRAYIIRQLQLHEISLLVQQIDTTAALHLTSDVWRILKTARRLSIAATVSLQNFLSIIAVPILACMRKFPPR